MSHEEILQVIREQVATAAAQKQCEADFKAKKLPTTIKLRTQDGKEKIIEYTKDQVIARCVEKKTASTGKAPFAIKPQENRTIKKSVLEQIIKEEIANVIVVEQLKKFKQNDGSFAPKVKAERRTPRGD